MIRVGKITGSKVARPKNATSGYARLLQVQIGPQLETMQLVPQAGEDVNPPVGSVVVLIESGQGILFAVASHDRVVPEVAEGERELYSTTGVTKRARIKLKVSGNVCVINDLTGFNLRAVLENLILGLQGATVLGNPITDSTGKIATALVQLQGLLDASP